MKFEDGNAQFDGDLLSACDLMTEQDSVGKRRIHGRDVIGSGTPTGLKVGNEVSGRQIVIGPGTALGGSGNEVPAEVESKQSTANNR